MHSALLVIVAQGPNLWRELAVQAMWHPEIIVHHQMIHAMRICPRHCGTEPTLCRDSGGMDIANFRRYFIDKSQDH